MRYKIYYHAYVYAICRFSIARSPFLIFDIMKQSRHDIRYTIMYCLNHNLDMRIASTRILASATITYSLTPRLLPFPWAPF